MACSFCHRDGHNWPTCRKKFRADGLMHQMIAAIISEEVRAYLSRAFPGATGLLVKTGNVALNAYDHAGGRWALVKRPLQLRGRRRAA
jgi:hypothetical protein